MVFLGVVKMDYYYILFLFGGIFLGAFIEWVWTRPEPQPEVNLDEWEECMKQCTAYSKKEDDSSRQERRKGTNTKIKSKKRHKS